MLGVGVGAGEEWGVTLHVGGIAVDAAERFVELLGEYA